MAAVMRTNGLSVYVNRMCCGLEIPNKLSLYKAGLIHYLAVNPILIFDARR